jgi:lipopolysaccharide/colanic/teichoic acid biosynthesis glycosyltransferase
MGLEPLKTSLETEAGPASLPDHFYSAAAVIEGDRYRWCMEDLDPIEAEVNARFERLSIRVQLVVKRLMDAVGSFLIIVALSPVLLLTALAVRLTSPGPILFSHKRWGLNEAHFLCLKFRSMRQDKDNVFNRKEVQEVEKTGTLIKLKEDPRLTIIGSFIRKTSIDELPQLFNVLKGDMSLVGPRPLVLHMMDPYPQVRRLRCKVRPGITGMWQIRERENNTSVIAMMPHDVDYLLHYSIWLDIKLLLVTVPAVLWGTGAV